jgi:protein TonB
MKPTLAEKQVDNPVMATSPEPRLLIESESGNTRSKLAVLFVIAALLLVMVGLGWLYKAFGSKRSPAPRPAPELAPLAQQQAPPPPTTPIPAIPAPPASVSSAAIQETPPQSREESIVADDIVQSRNTRTAYRDQASLVIMPGGKPAPKDDSPAEAPSISVAPNGGAGAINLPGTIAKPQLLASQGTVTGGRLLYRVEPIYPPFAKQQHLQGSVVLSARVMKDGSVDRLKRISGSPVLEQAAVAAVRQWKYEPYKLNGEPQDVDISITVQFRLR